MVHSPSKWSPIHVLAGKLGAQFIEVAGWQVPQVYRSVEEEVAAARNGDTLVDASANSKIVVQGESSEVVLQATWGFPSVIIGQGVIIEPGYLYRLRRDLFFIQSPPGTEGEVLRRLLEVTQDRNDTMTVTEFSHGWADLLLAGPDCPTLLSRLCGLDFHPDLFPDLSAKQSSVAKSRQLILRRDLGQIPAYSLVGARSLAAFVWETILEAGRDLGILPAGQIAIERLQQESPSDG